MQNILQTDHLTKAIGKKELVSDVSLHIKKGEIYGFLGPNGAGKTTVMKMLTNLWKPSGGSVTIFGRNLSPDSYEVLKRIGSIIEFPTFYEHTLSKQRNTRSEKNQFLLLLRCFPSAYVQYASVKCLAGTKIGFFPTLRP
mgnify:CR=1 FL=1